MRDLPRPLVVYDGDCDFCKHWVDRWRHATGGQVDYASSQDVAGRFPEIPTERFQEAVYLLEPDGGTYRGAQAVFRALGHGGRGRWLLSAYRSVPGFAHAAESFYAAVAAHRTAASRLTRWLWGRRFEAPTHRLTRFVFLRLLGVIYFLAFASLGLQIEGLVGSNGILPLARYLEAVSGQLGPERFWYVPTLCWLDTGDGMLLLLCWGGAALSLLVIAGVLAGPTLFVLWVFYLSITYAGQTFLHFQWDLLLLETGFLAIFFAPMNLRPGLSRERPPSRMFLWLLRWLTFRLLFASGYVKLRSGDPTWRDLTALQYHYETQPLPPWTAWYAHQLPAWFQKTSVALMFGIELAVPFLIFCPRRLRHLAVPPLMALQVLILLTGNYGFFNWLTLLLCLTLLDDAALRRFLPRRLGAAAGEATARAPRWRGWLLAPVAAGIVLLSGLQMARMVVGGAGLPGPARTVLGWAAPGRFVSSYGLFAVMTTERPEIVLEGSDDGRTWVAYEFRWKPGDPSRRPRFVAPHMPRLDWQMWFAALGDYRRNPWLQNFMVRLLQGRPEVLALLSRDPFPDAPPRYLRATLYDYHFTDPATRRKDGNWWRRERRGLYAPVLSRRR